MHKDADVIVLYDGSPDTIPCSQCGEPVESDHAVHLSIKVKYPERAQDRHQQLHLSCYLRVFQPLLDAQV